VTATEIDVTTPSDIGLASNDAEPSGRIEHLTVTERVAKGKEARAAVPRSSHGSWEPARERRDPIDLLEAHVRESDVEGHDHPTGLVGGPPNDVVVGTHQPFLDNRVRVMAEANEQLDSFDRDVLVELDLH
jgi:hypothetical protein